MTKQPETESTAAAAYWAGHAAESAAEAREYVEQGVHIEITGEAAERAREAAERMRRGEQDITFTLTDDGTIYRTLVEVVEEGLAQEAVKPELALAQKRAPIIAVDFDGTLCENKWPEIGAPKWNTIQTRVAAQAAGARLVLWTNRVGARLREAVEWCRNRELEFDAVNENLPEIKAAFTTDCRKVYADIYLDDRAAQPSAAVLSALWETARGVMNEVAKKAEEEQG